jgi:hypothetical protein
MRPTTKGEIMHRYAILIQAKDLDLITLLNQGVTPAIEAKPTYFVFDAEWNTEVPNEIVTEEELIEHGAFEDATRPIVYRME